MRQCELSTCRFVYECHKLMAPIGALAQQVKVPLDILGNKRLSSLATFALHQYFYFFPFSHAHLDPAQCGDGIPSLQVTPAVTVACCTACFGQRYPSLSWVCDSPPGRSGGRMCPLVLDVVLSPSGDRGTLLPDADW